MDLPDGYLDALRDELAPFGLEFAAQSVQDGRLCVEFGTDPGSFASQYPWLRVAQWYGTSWPPSALTLRLLFDRGDPTEITFETIDLLAQTASTDPALHDRLNTLGDPDDQAAAVGQALAEALSEPGTDPVF